MSETTDRMYRINLTAWDGGHKVSLSIGDLKEIAREMLKGYTVIMVGGVPVESRYVQDILDDAIAFYGLEAQDD